MLHYVLMQYEKGFLTDEEYNIRKEAFLTATGEIEGISDCKVSRNIGKRDGNMDMIVSFELSDEKYLAEYIKHPAHQKVMKMDIGHLIAKASIDI